MIISDLKTKPALKEGGNVFKSNQPVRRINRSEIFPTVSWLESQLGLPLSDRMLGSTGKKPTSGDIDLAVDANQISKDQLIEKLKTICEKLDFDPTQSIKKTGSSVHFKTPINGNPSDGFVQTDFIFTDDVDWTMFAMSSNSTTDFPGKYRAILLNSIATHLGLKFSPTRGIVSRTSGESITKDPDYIAEILLGNGADRQDLESVESMLAKLSVDPHKKQKIEQARNAFAKENLELK